MSQAASWETGARGGAGPEAGRPAEVPPERTTLSAVPPIEGPATRPVPAHQVDHEADRQLGLGRAILRGSLIGFVVVAAAAFGIARAAGWSSGSALGVAAFAGLWGGPGFGGMMGATLAANRSHD
jgi:hypothetical protein